MSDTKKIIAIGDIHGRVIWQDIVSLYEADKYIFIGDYLDTRDDITVDAQIENLKAIIAFKDQNPDNVVLLFGNHDYHYLPFINQTYSGFNWPMKLRVGEDILVPNLSKFKMCHREGDFLFSHAGISNTWLVANGWDGDDVEQFVNDLWVAKPNAFENKGPSPYGDDRDASPIWIRPKSLIESNFVLLPYNQVVGHTPSDIIKLIGNYYFIDALEDGYFLGIDFMNGQTNAKILKIDESISYNKKNI